MTPRRLWHICVTDVLSDGKTPGWLFDTCLCSYVIKPLKSHLTCCNSFFCMFQIKKKKIKNKYSCCCLQSIRSLFTLTAFSLFSSLLLSKRLRPELCNNSILFYFCGLSVKQQGGCLLGRPQSNRQTDLGQMYLPDALRLVWHMGQSTCLCLRFPGCVFVCVSVGLCLSNLGCSVGVMEWARFSLQIGSRWQSENFVVVWGPVSVQ